MNEDLEAEQGLPEPARRLKQLMLSHQGFLISCPEYNSSITPLLKNTIDWASRPVPGEGAAGMFCGQGGPAHQRVARGAGGLRGLVHVRAILGNLGTLVLPSTISISKAHESFAADGTLSVGGQHQKVERLGAELANFLRKVQD